MRLAIMQPYFFPYIGYFQCIHSVEKYLLYEHLNYIKEGWMHRNRILVKNGKPAYFSTQLKGKSSNTRISEIELSDAPSWRRKLKNALHLNYKGAAYFEETYPILEPLIDEQTRFLHNYNSNIIKCLCKHLNISTRIVSDNENYLPIEEELNQLYAKDGDERKPVKKVLRAIKICQNEKADVLVNACGGRNLYDKAEFSKYGISLYFIETLDITYPQFSSEFHPNLSIIDVLMHNGREATEALIQRYRLT